MNISKLTASAIAILFSFGAFATEPVDINSANVQDLADAIIGVGLKRAEAIVRYRDTHGAFTSIEGLSQVSGIGDKAIEKSRDNLTVKPVSN